MTGWDLDACQFGNSGQPVNAGNHREIIDFPRRDFARPADNSRHADAALVQASLAPTKRPGAAHAAMAGIADVDVLGTIVAGEKDHRVVGETQFIERRKEAADLFVHIGDRAVEDLRGTFEWKILSDRVEKI